MGGLLSGISSFMGAIGGLVNGPKRQYRFQRKLMDRQAELNEIAAENNQRRAMDMYNHQFQTQTAYNDEKISQANQYNSAASARARAEMAGLSKASVGSSTAIPAASSSPGGVSASGSGQASGVGLPSVDVVGYGRNLVASGDAVSGAIRDITRIANETKLTESQSGLMEAQTALAAANELQTRASTSLINSQVIGQDTQNKILALQAEITEATKDTAIAMSSAQYVQLVSSAYKIYEEAKGQLMHNRVFEKYGEKQAQAYLNQTLASIVVSYAQSNDLYSHAGLNKEMASLYGQLYLNAVSDGTIKSSMAKFADRIASASTNKLEREVSRLDTEISRMKFMSTHEYMQFKQSLREFDLKQKATALQLTAEFGRVITGGASMLSNGINYVSYLP